MRLLTAAVLSVGVFSSLVGAGAQPVRLPVYGVRHVTDAVRVDGTLNETTWALASRLGEIRRVDNPSQRPSFPSEATVAWDQTHLYVAVACTDAAPAPRFRQRDHPLWEDDAIQVVLDPDRDGRDYVELAVNAHNTVADRLVSDAASLATANLAWNIAGLRTAVQRHRAGWIVEIGIPWAALAAPGRSTAPKPGDQWGAALYRIKRLEDGFERTAWSPPRVERGAHDPERFGYFLFMPPATAAVTR